MIPHPCSEGTVSGEGERQRGTEQSWGQQMWDLSKMHAKHTHSLGMEQSL